MKPLYKYSAETARHNGELDAWRESKKRISAVGISLTNRSQSALTV